MQTKCDHLIIPNLRINSLSNTPMQFQADKSQAQDKMGNEISTELSNQIFTPPAKKQKTGSEGSQDSTSTVTIPSWHCCDGSKNKQKMAVLQQVADKTQEGKEKKLTNERPSWHNYDASEAVERIWPSMNKGKRKENGNGKGKEKEKEKEKDKGKGKEREVVNTKDMEDLDSGISPWDGYLIETLREMEEELESWLRDPGIVGWNGRKVGESSKMGEMRGRRYK
ncbi:hypothetical protein HYALB_00001665 [Hymenoscyphus albidus]|uniref:Uncharacterized protein n=1 Tax=Hymenoscyphus albidus TaxID=595503 RepID=A0A9N9LGH5_9HELO|nr:hypothetical protein HYALB_00001665 [Hymenoscyphus albidus]